MNRIGWKRKSALALAGGNEEGRRGWMWKRKSALAALAGGNEEGEGGWMWGMDCGHEISSHLKVYKVQQRRVEWVGDGQTARH